MIERRRFQRFDIVMDAAYMRTHGITSIKSLTTTENISLGGVCIKISKTIHQGDELMIELTSAPNQGLLTMAIVKWVMEDKAKGVNICGLEFQWVSSKSIIGEYVAMASKAAANLPSSPKPPIRYDF